MGIVLGTGGNAMHKWHPNQSPSMVYKVLNYLKYSEETILYTQIYKINGEISVSKEMVQHA